MFWAVVLAVVIGAVVGAVVGAAIGARVSGARRRDAAGSTHALPRTPTPDRSTAELRAAVDRLPIGVVVFGADGKITYRNGAAEAMSGTHAGLIVDDHLAHAFRDVLAGNAASRLAELYGPPKQLLAIDAQLLADGGAVATVTDISERALIDSMRTDFVANVSHELKTPVGAIAVLADTLRDEPDRTVAADLSERLVEEAHRAVRTIDDLLELSQIESTRPVEEVLELTDVIELAVARGHSTAQGRDISIAALPAGSVRIRADRRQLVSALGNLVENAVKYSHDGGTVQVRTRLGDRWVEVMVADQGVGIPPGDVDRIFERFYRVDKARTRRTGGTGLGLSIVRHVATGHGGEVAVQSQEGEGSTFVFRLPARLVVGADAPPPGAGAQGFDEQARTGAGDDADE